MTEETRIRHVLFPTDFSAVSRRAGRRAADLARRFGARLHVLHVVPPVTDPTPTPESLRRAVAELGAGLDVVAATDSGTPARRITAYARRAGVDLIVMGTHGRTGFSRALLGSVAEAVVRLAPCEVLTVPAAATEPVVAGDEARAVGDEPSPVAASCIVCATASSDLICPHCRALIRGEALEHKRIEERAGRLA